MPDQHDFYAQPSLNVESYDSWVERNVVADDFGFYLACAREVGGPILDLGGGTGRLAWPLAEAGFDVTSLDLSSAMLAVSRDKEGAASETARGRVQLVEGDIRDFALPTQFGFAIAPGRVFQLLLTPADQRAALATITRHLRPGGLLVLHLFDPRLDLCLPMDGPPPQVDRGTGIARSSGHSVVIRSPHRTNDPLTQVLSEIWEFTELDERGTVVRQEQETLQMRWTYRYEMRHLLELSGFEIEAEFSDFQRAGPRYGAEQIWVARRPT